MIGRQPASPQKIQESLRLISKPLKPGWDLSPTDDVGQMREPLLNHTAYFDTRRTLRGDANKFGWLDRAEINFRFITRTNGLGSLAIAQLEVAHFQRDPSSFMYITTQQEAIDGEKLSSEHVAIKGIQNLIHGQDEQQSAWLKELHRMHEYNAGTDEAWQQRIDQLITYTPQTTLAA